MLSPPHDHGAGSGHRGGGDNSTTMAPAAMSSPPHDHGAGSDHRGGGDNSTTMAPATMLSPPHDHGAGSDHRGGGDNSTTTAPAATSVALYTHGATAAVPTLNVAGMVMDFAPSLSPNAADVGDAAAMGTSVPSSEHAAMATDTHVTSESMIEGSTSSTLTGTAMIHPSLVDVSATDSRVSQVEV